MTITSRRQQRRERRAQKEQARNETIMASLVTIPRPGFAAYPEYIANQPTSLHFEHGAFSHTWWITLDNETHFMRVHFDSLSLSRRITLYDSQDHALGCIRKKKWGLSTYYFETTTGEQPITIWAPMALFGHREVELTFNNNAASGELAHLRCRLDFWNCIGWAHRGGQEKLALIERCGWGTLGSDEYKAWVAQGLDLFLVVVMVMVFDDRARAAQGGRGGGGGGFYCGGFYG